MVSRKGGRSFTRMQSYPYPAYAYSYHIKNIAIKEKDSSGISTRKCRNSKETRKASTYDIYITMWKLTDKLGLHEFELGLTLLPRLNFQLAYNTCNIQLAFEIVQWKTGREGELWSKALREDQADWWQLKFSNPNIGSHYIASKIKANTTLKHIFLSKICLHTNLSTHFLYCYRLRDVKMTF